ncbi:immunoglobulin domain protein, partial [Trichuris suis]
LSICLGSVGQPPAYVVSVLIKTTYQCRSVAVSANDGQLLRTGCSQSKLPFSFSVSQTAAPDQRKLLAIASGAKASLRHLLPKRVVVGPTGAEMIIDCRKAWPIFFFSLLQAFEDTQTRSVKELLAPQSTSVSLSCKPLLMVNKCHSASWFKDGQTLGTSSTQHNLILRFNTSVPVPDDVPQIGLLQLVGLRKGDDGRFWCICNGIVGQVVRVRIVYLDTWFKTTPQVIHTSVGHSVVLKCRSPAGFPGPNLRWEKDGKIVRPNGQHKMVSPSDLMIISATEEDTGEYTCIVWNVVGERRFYNHLIVQQPLEGQNIRPMSSLGKASNEAEDSVCVVGIASYLLSAVVLLLLIMDVAWNVRPVLARLGVRLCHTFYRYPRRGSYEHRLVCPPPYDLSIDHPSFIAYQIPPPPYSLAGARLMRNRPVSMI